MLYRFAHSAVFGGLIAMSPLLGRDLSGLAKKNPFAETDKTAVSKPADAVPAVQLELRGVVKETGGYLLNVYEVQTLKSHWVRTGDKFKTLSIGRYDALRETLLIESGEQLLTLALKAPGPREISRGPAALATNAGTATEARFRITAPVLTAAPAENEGTRLERVAQEIKLRREQRRKDSVDGGISKT